MILPIMKKFDSLLGDENDLKNLCKVAKEKYGHQHNCLTEFSAIQAATADILICIIIMTI